jgi:hypothetical protein
MLDEASIDDAGNIAGASVSTVQSWFNDLIGEFVTQNMEMFLLHENPATNPTQIVNLSVQGQIATQRRRMR